MFFADWTTAGPYKELTWLTIIFTIGVVATLILALFGARDAWKTYRAVRIVGEDNPGMEVLIVSTLLRSLARVAIQVAFLILACTAIYIAVSENTEHLHWYRVTFILSFLIAEALLCFSAINDLVAKHKLEEYIVRRREHQ